MSEIDELLMPYGRKGMKPMKDRSTDNPSVLIWPGLLRTFSLIGLNKQQPNFYRASLISFPE